MLVPQILAQENGFSREDAGAFLTDRDDLDLTASDASYVIEQLLDRGYLYEVENTLFVTNVEQ